ncbi:MAG: hypothetical protein FJ399_03970 [Verrucomicrobia bacterium]|nr:hypothetical protein [Verrucomicrobiota bacterium]
MTTLTNGYVPFAKGNWREPRVEMVRERSLAALRTVGPERGYRVVGGERLITTDAEALAAVEEFGRERVDVVVCQYITFALGSMTPLIAERAQVPLVLWSMPEPPMEGGRISANSFCAVNMNAHALWKLRVRYLHVHAPVEAAVPRLRSALGPVAAVKRLRRTKIGLVGARAPGFYTSNANELLLRRRLGVEIDYITLLELTRLAEQAPAEKVDAALALLMANAGGVCGPDAGELRKGAALYVAFQEVRQRFNVDVFSVKCWPEFAQYYGIGVCAVMGMLNNQAIMTGCEGDIYGTVTMVVENEITGGLPFFCDLISIDGEGDVGVTWHCGAAPKGLCCTAATPNLRKHSIIDGGDKKGLTNEFPLKPGRVTLARISETRDNDHFRMLITTGTGLETPLLLRGNPLRVKFDVPLAGLARKLVYEGFEHHFALVHGEIVEELEHVCRLLDLEPIVLR